MARQRLAPSVPSKEGYDCRVHSTLNLLYDIEMACRDPLLAHIDAGKDSVGIEKTAQRLQAKRAKAT